MKLHGTQMHIARIEKQSSWIYWHKIKQTNFSRHFLFPLSKVETILVDLILMYRDIELAWSKWLWILQNQHEWRNTLEPMNAGRNKYQAAMVAPRSRVMYKSTGQFYIRFSFQSPRIAPDIRVPAPHWPDWCKTRYSALARSFLCLLNRSWSKHFGHLYLAAKKTKIAQSFFLSFRLVFYYIPNECQAVSTCACLLVSRPLIGSHIVLIWKSLKLDIAAILQLAWDSPVLEYILLTFTVTSVP